MFGRRVALALTLCTAAALVVSTAASAQEERRCEPSDVSRRLVMNDGPFQQGDPIRMRLVVENTSDSSCEMEFPSGRGGTVRVFKNGQKVWEHGYCRVYTQQIEFETWEPGHREVYRYRWKQYFTPRNEQGRVDCDGKRDPAKRGHYSARGIFFGSDPDARTKPVEFRISG